MFIYASAASRFVIASRHDPEPEPAPLLEVKLLARHRPQGVAPRHRGPLLTSHLFDLAFQRGGRSTTRFDVVRNWNLNVPVL